MSWVWLALGIGSEVAATLSLRASDGFRRRRWILPIVVGYLLAFGFLALSLHAGLDVGVAYGIWAAAGVAIIAILARIVFHDPFTVMMRIGIVLIAGGVLLVELGARG